MSKYNRRLYMIEELYEGGMLTKAEKKRMMRRAELKYKGVI